MEPVVLVISGAKQSGKGTLFKFIRAANASRRGIVDTLLLRPGRPVEEFFFAYLLKRFCVDVLGLREEQAFGTDDDKNTLVPHLLWENFPVSQARMIKNEHGYVTSARSGPMTGREVLQYVGTELVREFYGEAWPRATHKMIRDSDAYRRGGVCVVTDGRFPNEMDISKNEGAVTLRLTRRPFADSHASEHALDADRYDWNRFDYVLDNSRWSANLTCIRAAPFLRSIGAIPADMTERQTFRAAEQATGCQIWVTSAKDVA